MKPARAGSLKPFLAGALASGLAAFIPLSGCDGGTSTGADNPDLILQVRSNGAAVEFNGFIQFFVKNSNPDFFSPPADDDGNTPRVVIQDGPGSTFIMKGERTFSVPRDILARLMNARPSLPLYKTAAAPAPEIPDFNVVLIGFDSTAGLLSGIHCDSATGRFGAADGGRDTLIIDIFPEREYAGTVDTTTSAGKALALFVPGTPFYAQVDGDAFHFTGVPAGKMPLRWVSATGVVRDMPDSLGALWTHPLRPGDRIDSIRIPPAVPTLPPPAASPAGQYAFTDTVAVILTAQTGAVIYYTLDGKSPTPASPRYTAPIVLRASATIMAVAYLKDWNRSPVSVNNYLLAPEPPAASPPGKAFRDSLSVTLSAKPKNAVIYYTLDGSAPSSATSPKYAAPLVLKAGATLHAIAGVPGLGDSRMLEEKYILLTDSLAAGQ